MPREKTQVICPDSKEPYVYEGWLEKCPLKFYHPYTCNLCKKEERYKDKWWIENAKTK